MPSANGVHGRTFRFIGLALLTAALLSMPQAGFAQAPPFQFRWDVAGNISRGVACGPDGNIYATCYTRGLVQVFTPLGGFLRSWSAAGSSGSSMSGPAGIAVDNEGTVYVVDSGNARIDKFASDGTFIDSFGSGILPSVPSWSSGIAISPLGYVYVTVVPAVYGIDQVYQFTTAGTFVRSWGQVYVNGGLYNPWYVACDDLGHIYITNGGNGWVLVFDSDANFLTRWYVDGTPMGVDVAHDGTVYIGTWSPATLSAYTATGVRKWQTGGDFTSGQMIVPAVAEDGSIYVANMGILKFGPRSGLRPVVLLHGYCGSASDWTALGDYLTQHGFSPHAFDYSPSNGKPSVLAAQLADYLDTQFPDQDVDIIAHSMGGLVARQLIRQRGENCHVRTLITLGTPHHGVDLLRHITEDRAFQEYLSYVPGLGCLLGGAGAVEITPGSNFLNRLNYGTYDAIDRANASTRGAHPAEYTYSSGVTCWSIAGTAQFDGVASAATQWAWGLTYRNDGVVGVDAAVLWNDLGKARIDVDMGLSPIQHFGPALLYLGTRDFQNAQDLFPILENLLRGAGAPASPPTQARAAAVQAMSSSDSTFSLVKSEAGVLKAQQVTPWSFTLPGSHEAQVVTIADSAGVTLRMPDGTLLTPSDTLRVEGMSYRSEPGIGLGIYRFARAMAGVWSVLFDTGTRHTDGSYAASAYVWGTTQVSVLATPSQVYGATTHLEARLLRDDAPTPDVTWTASVLGPDSSLASAILYDDGAHGDGNANDGNYGADLALAGPRGTYRVTTTAVDPADHVTYVGGAAVEALTFADVAIDPALSFTKNVVMAGESTYVGSTVRNLGAASADSLVFELWDNHHKRDAQVLSLAGGQSRDVTFLWHAAEPDTHLIELVVNPFRLADDASNDNNAAARLLVLGQPVVGVDDLTHVPGRTLLATARPNPSSGQTVLGFSLARASGATLTLFDVLGRRVRQWRWASLSSGAHEVEWNGESDDGRKTPPGILFCRLEAGGASNTQKLIHVR